MNCTSRLYSTASGDSARTAGDLCRTCSSHRIGYLKQLGVTAVELMPVHQFVEDKHLVEQGLTQLLGV